MLKKYNRKKYDIFDALYWRGDLGFEDSEFNGIDNIIFSLLSYFKLDGIVSSSKIKPYITLEKVFERMEDRFSRDASVYTSQAALGDFQHDFMRETAFSARYRDTGLAGFVNLFDNVRELQFAAVTFFPKNEVPYIAFRGTDSTLVGLKEDCNMAVSEEIPAQAAAKRYLENATEGFKGGFYVGGHSKGGNLAVFASATVDIKIQKRIKKIFTNDGPGFQEKFLQSEGFRRIKNKITAYIPEFSIIGLLFERDYPVTVVASGAQGLFQHNPYTWLVTPRDFQTVTHISKTAAKLNELVMSWINTLDMKKREQLIESVYRMLTATSTRLQSFLKLQKEARQNGGAA